MVLTVDVGNTNIVFGGFEGDTLRFTSVSARTNIKCATNMPSNFWS